MDAARLGSYVHVDGVVYGPDDDVPDEVAARIVNSAAWVDGVMPTVPDDVGSVSPGSDPGVNDVGDGEPSQQVEPPRAGKGSGRDVWAAHADSLNVAYADGASRDDIISAVDQAKPQQ